MIRLFWLLLLTSGFVYSITRYVYQFNADTLAFAFSWEFGHAIVTSMTRWAIGLIIGSLLGILFAYVQQRQVFCWVKPRKWVFFDFSYALNFIRFAPIIALPAVVIFISGSAEIGKVTIIALSALIPSWLVLSNSLSKMEQDTLLVYRAAGFQNREILIHIVPQILSNDFYSSFRLSMSSAWLSLVAAEMLGIVENGSFWSNGLGYQLWRAMESFSLDIVILSIATFSLLGILSDLLFRHLTTHKTLRRRT